MTLGTTVDEIRRHPGFASILGVEMVHRIYADDLRYSKRTRTPTIAFDVEHTNRMLDAWNSSSPACRTFTDGFGEFLTLARAYWNDVFQREHLAVATAVSANAYPHLFKVQVSRIMSTAPGFLRPTARYHLSKLLHSMRVTHLALDYETGLGCSGLVILKRIAHNARRYGIQPPHIITVIQPQFRPASVTGMLDELATIDRLCKDNDIGLVGANTRILRKTA